MTKEKPEDNATKETNGDSRRALVLHAMKTGPLAYVEEAMASLGIEAKGHPILEKNLAKLHKQQRLHDVFNLWALFFTVIFYWAIIQAVVTSALARIGLPLPAFIESFVLILTPVAVPGMIVFGRLCNAMEKDEQNTKAFCLGLVTAASRSRGKSTGDS